MKNSIGLYTKVLVLLFGLTLVASCSGSGTTNDNPDVTPANNTPQNGDGDPADPADPADPTDPTDPVITTYTVSIEVVGLTQAVTLQLNADEVLSVSTNDIFTFSTPLSDGDTYEVGLISGSASETCALDTASGQIAAANVQLVLTCVNSGLPDPVTEYSVKVEVTGLNGDAEFQLNEEDTLLADADGTYTFDKTLADNESYSLIVLEAPITQTCVLDQDEGVISGQDVLVVFTCVDKSWDHPASVANSKGFAGQYVSNADLAANADGDALLVWSAGREDSSVAIYLSEYADGAWLAPDSEDDVVSLSGAGAADFPKSAINDSGDAILVWAQFNADSSDVAVFKSERTSGVWQEPSDFSENISPAIGEPDLLLPKVVMSNNGDTVIAWIQIDTASSHRRVCVAHKYDGVWADSFFVSPSSSDAYNLDLAIDEFGNAVLVWVQTEGLFKAEFRDGAWDIPSDTSAPINPSGSDLGQGIRVLMNSNDVAVILWLQKDSFETMQLFSLYHWEGEWETVTSVEDHLDSTGHSVMSFDAALNDKNELALVWGIDDTAYQIYRTEYSGKTWSGSNTAISSSLTDAIFPSVAIDEQDQIISIWVQDDGTSEFHVFEAERRDSIWDLPDTDALQDHISPAGSSVVFSGAMTLPKAVMSDSGVGFVYWLQTDTALNQQVFVSVYE